MSRRSRLFSSLFTAGVACAAALPAASSAAPRLTDYTLTGSFEVWTEPAPTPPDTYWAACAVETPKLSFTAVTEDKRPRLNLAPLVRLSNGLTVPMQGLFSYFQPTSIAISDGPREVDGAVVFGDGRAAASFPLTATGRVTVQGWLSYAQGWGGLSFPVTRPVPTRSVPLRKVAKPAGTCAAEPGATLLQLF